MKKMLLKILLLSMAAILSCSQQNIWDNGTDPIDNTPPEIDSVEATSNIYVQVVFAEDVEKTSAETPENYSINGLNVTGATRSDTDYRTVILETGPQQDIDYTLEITNVYDNFLNEVLSLSPITVEFNGDASPFTDITNPLNGSFVNGTVVITAAASDDAGIKLVEIYIDNILKNSLPSAPYEYSWDTTSLGYGSGSTHTIKSVCYDRSENSLSDDDTTVTFDNLAPVVNITAPTGGTTIYNTTTITADASDTVSGINYVEFFIDNVSIGTDSTAPYEYTWDTTAYSNASCSISAIAYDNAGNSQADNDTTITVNNFGTKLIGSSADDYGIKTAVDSLGNIYITGCTKGDLDGNGNRGLDDIFIQKFGADGSSQWTTPVQIGSSANDKVEGIAIDSYDDIYVLGSTEGNLFGTNTGGSDIFIYKSDSAGSPIVKIQTGTSSNDYGYGIAIDGNNDVCITGSSEEDIDAVGSAEHKELLDCIIIKYNSNLVFQWASEIGSTTGLSANDEGLDIAIDSSNNIYVTGYTEGDLGGSSTSSKDAFLAKFTSAGTYYGAIKLDSSASVDTSESVYIDANDNVYIAGTTTGDLSGDGNYGAEDLFIMKYDSTLTAVWLNPVQIGSSELDQANDIICDNNNDIYITGYTNGTLPSVGSSSGSKEMYLIKLDPAVGATLWTRQYGSTSFQINGVGLAHNAGNSIYMTGYTDGNLDGVTNTGLNDAFLLRYDSEGNRN